MLAVTVEPPTIRPRQTVPRRTGEREHWTTDLLPIMRTVPTFRLVELTGYSRRHIKRLKAGSRMPRAKRVSELEMIIRVENPAGGVRRWLHNL